MSTGEWLTLGVGIGMLITITAICLRGKRMPDSCANCLHDDAADENGQCLNADAYSGWGSDRCTCTDHYHLGQQRE